MLSIEGLVAGYGEVRILDGIDLEVTQGDIVTLVGANGAGKTTAIRAISGTLPVAAGSIRFQGEDITTLPAHRRVARGLVRVPEGRKIFSQLSVLENLELGSYTTKARRRRADTLERVFSLFPILKERIRQPGGTLSGGEQQMLAIGRGLMALPSLIILDEPSLGLAPKIVRDIFATVEEINRGGTTVLLVEQDVQHALAMAGKGYVLESGRIVLSGGGRELLADPYLKEAFLGL